MAAANSARGRSCSLREHGSGVTETLGDDGRGQVEIGAVDQAFVVASFRFSRKNYCPLGVPLTDPASATSWRAGEC